MLLLKFNQASVAMSTDQADLETSFNSFFEKSFPKRYLPDYYLDSDGDYDAKITWLKSESFRVLKTIFSSNTDEYVVETPPPSVYTNESPVFFLLQVLAKILVKKKIYMLSDSVTVFSKGKTLLFLGYPHSGKSTIAALALSKGDTPLSTENTLLEVSSDCVKVVGGSSILVYDPRVEEKYGVEIPYVELTKHGYRVVDLNVIAKDRLRILMGKPCIDEVYLIHCMFNARDVSIEEVKGRKIGKTLWYFATLVLKGVDYYDPHPLDFMDSSAEVLVREMMRFFIDMYKNKFYEVFGRHDKVYEYVRNKA